LTVDLAPKGPLTADNKTNPAVPGMPPPPAVPPLTGDKSPLPPPTGLGNAPPPGPLAGNPTPPNTDPLLGKVQPSAIDKVPVIPGPGAATTGQIPIPSGQPVPATVSGKPQVEHYDAKVYSVTGEDTDFATLSKKFYGGSDRYAQALIEYNRDVFGNGATAQAPRVTPGSRVEIPPLHVLETKYPNAIAGLKPIQQGGPNSFDSNPAPPAKLVPVVNGPASGSPAPPPVAPWGAPPGQPPAQPPQPIQPSVPPPPTSPGFGPAAPQANANTPTPGTYVVPPPGQHYFQIAQQALGNADRWSEIYKLNTQYDPSNIVPAGTQLQLPAAAPPAVRFSDLRDQMSY
jgi:hypothetical protein